MKSTICKATLLALASFQASAAECNLNFMANGQNGAIQLHKFTTYNAEVESGFTAMPELRIPEGHAVCDASFHAMYAPEAGSAPHIADHKTSSGIEQNIYKDVFEIDVPRYEGLTGDASIVPPLPGHVIMVRRYEFAPPQLHLASRFINVSLVTAYDWHSGARQWQVQVQSNGQLSWPELSATGWATGAHTRVSIEIPLTGSGQARISINGQEAMAEGSVNGPMSVKSVAQGNLGSFLPASPVTRFAMRNIVTYPN